MGMYDSVFAPCPCCNQELEWQTKAGDCNLDSYSPEAVPLDVAKGVNGDIRTCSYCGVRVTILIPRYADTIKMDIVTCDAIATVPELAAKYGLD